MKLKRLFGLLACALAPLTSYANLDLNTSVSCTGDLTISVIADHPANIGCTGSLSFTGASALADTQLDIWATQDLSLFDVLVTAPTLTFTSGGTFLLDADSVVKGREITITAGSSLVVEGTIASVPEPSSIGLALCGITGLLVIRRRPR